MPSDHQFMQAAEHVGALLCGTILGSVLPLFIPVEHLLLTFLSAVAITSLLICFSGKILSRAMLLLCSFSTATIITTSAIHLSGSIIILTTILPLLVGAYTANKIIQKTRY